MKIFHGFATACIAFLAYASEGKAQSLPDDIISQILSQAQAQISSSLPQRLDEDTVLVGVVTFGRVFIFNYNVSLDHNREALDIIKSNLHSYWCINESQSLWRDNNVTVVYNWVFQTGDSKRFQIDLSDC